MSKISNIIFFSTIFLILIVITGCKNDTNESSQIKNIQQSQITRKQTIEDTIQPNKSEQQTKLVVGISADQMPFSFMKDGEIVGFEIDLIKAIGQKIDAEIVIKDMPFYTLIPALESKNISLIISSMSMTPDRAKVVDFSLPYYVNDFVFIGIQNITSDDSPITEGMKIGVQNGTLMYQWLQKQDIKITIVVMDKNLELIEELKNHHIDGILLDSVIAKDVVKHNNNFKIVVLNTMNQDGMAIAVRHDDPLLTNINNAIVELQNNGTMLKFQSKWGL